MSETPTIAVIGGGYGGLMAAHRAAQTLGDSGGRVVIIDPSPKWVERTRWHQVASGAEVAATPRAELFEGTRVESMTAAVTSISASDATLTLDRQPGVIRYDRLVYALGSTTGHSEVPGMIEHAYSLRTAESSAEFARILESTKRPEVAVVGGGLTAIESAAEVAERHPDASVTLVSSGSLGGRLPEQVARRARRALEKMGVRIIENRRVTAVESDGVVAGGERIPSDATLWAAGFAVPALARDAGLGVDDAGRILVDSELRSTSDPAVYAVGDSAAVPGAVDGLDMGAYAALATGATAGRNAVDDLAGRPAGPLSLGYIALSLTLGRRDGVFQLLDATGRPRRLVLGGRIAAAAKEMLERYVASSVRAESRRPGAYRWMPAPRSRAAA